MPQFEQILWPLSDDLNYSGVDNMLRFSAGTASTVTLPAQQEILAPLPGHLRGTPISAYLRRAPRTAKGIRTHHAAASSLFDEGKNVLISTGTASGKSLIFMTEALAAIAKNPQLRVLALYPMRALGTNQLGKWQELIEKSGMDPAILAHLDGQTSAEKRASLLQKGRILVTTPDSLHSYLLPNLGEPATRDFFKNLSIKILDETHFYEGVFGTHTAFLLRRLEYIQSALNPDFKPGKHSRYIATTATISDAASFLKRLTGREFHEIGPDMDGSERYERTVTHVAPDAYLTLEKPQKALRPVTLHLALQHLQNNPSERLIVFIDSRTGVEEVAQAINTAFGRKEGNEIVLPYKSGFTSRDRADVEARMTEGKVQGIITTSALEAGVDLNFDMCLNEGVPEKLSSAIQRIGRTGRFRAGATVFIAPRDAFAAYSEDIGTYISQPLPAPMLYVGNPYIQLAQALCFRKERQILKEVLKITPPPASQHLRWPKGFSEALAQAGKPAREWPRETRHMMPVGQLPHKRHSLRYTGDFPMRMAIYKGHKHFEWVGDTPMLRAFSEYPPGALILQKGMRYRVLRWTEINGQPTVLLNPYTGPATTRTQHRAVITAEAHLDRSGIIGDRYLRDNETGSLVAECHLIIRKTIPSFRETFQVESGAYASKTYSYRDDFDAEGLKRASDDDLYDYGPKRRLRYNTTGVIIYIPAYWFGIERRKVMGEAIIEAMARKSGTSRNDISFFSRFSFIQTGSQQRLASNALIIYDKTPGSLGLSATVLSHFKAIMTDIAERHPDETTRKCALRMLERREAMRAVNTDTLDETYRAGNLPVTLPEGYARVIMPGSYILTAQRGLETKAKVIRPVLTEGLVAYQVVATDRTKFFRKRGAFSSDLGQARENASATLQHLIPEDNVELCSGRYGAMNLKTGELVQIFEKAASGAGDQAPKTAPENFVILGLNGKPENTLK